MHYEKTEGIIISKSFFDICNKFVTVQPLARFGCSAACFAAKAAKISLLWLRHMSKIVKIDPYE